MTYSEEEGPERGEVMPEAQFLERFVRGMLPLVKQKVINRDPRTPNEALKEAVKTESNKQYLERDNKSSSRVSATQASSSPQEKETPVAASFKQRGRSKGRPEARPT